MASDGPGKYKEKKNRSSKPYDRPKGLIRRVADSVTGLFSSSWLPGWLAGEDEEEAADPHQAGTSAQSTGSAQVKSMAPPGESFIFAQPMTGRRSFRPIYPEEGEIEVSNQHSNVVNAGASTSSGVRINLTTATSVAIPTATSTPLSTENPSPVLVGRRPIISSTPSQMFTARTKSQLEPRALPLLTSSTPIGDDASEFSESSADTGVDASIIPRPDERDYQRDILQLDDESLQTLRESLAKSAPLPPITQPASALPSLEETRKRPREAEPDQTSIRAEGSMSNRSLFSESGDVSLNQPQPSALASKRPRFNVSTYGSPLMYDRYRSVLSDSNFKMSPFYPGKTMFGGASAYRRGRQQMRSQTPRVQLKPKQPHNTDDGELSKSARRILECLEQMSTPIQDAKRIPTPIPGQRGSFLEAATYTAAYHRQRPAARRSGPPVHKASTPAKVSGPDKVVASAFSSTPTSVVPSTVIASTTPSSIQGSVFLDSGGGSKYMEGRESSSSKSKEDFNSNFSKAVAEATAKFKPSTPVVPAVSSSPPNMFNFGSSSNSSASLSTFEFTHKPPETSAAPFGGAKKAGGKVKSKVVSSGRASNKVDEAEELVEEPNLPSVSLTMSSLPKIDFGLTTTNSTPAKVSSTTAEGFKFASPEVVHGDMISPEVATTLPVFTFSSPAAVGRTNVNSHDSFIGAAPTVPTLLFNSRSSSTMPKLKEVVKKDNTTSKGELKEGSILDILKPKRISPEKSPKENSIPMFNSIGGKSPAVDKPHTNINESIPLCSSEQNVTVNSVAKKTESSQGFQGFSSFMKSSDEWECSMCMLRNKNSLEKCIACETPKPGLKSNSLSTSSISGKALGEPPRPMNSIVGDWGSVFKKSDNEWECEMCMIRNKISNDKCVACETPKHEPSLSQDSKISENKDEKTNSGFGSMFAKAKGEWECDTCLVRNKSDASKCVSCETPKPGAAPVSKAITGNFRFGVNTNDSSTSSAFKFGVSDSQSSTGSTFKFGASNSQSEANSSSGFKFGVSAKNTEESNNKGGSVGFKFGVSEGVKSSVLTGGSENGASDKSKENSEIASGSSSGFTFGVKSSESDSRAPNFNFPTNKLPDGKSESSSAMKTKFNFNTGSQDKPFTFGVGLKKKTENKDNTGSGEIKPAAELRSGSVTDILKEKDSTASAFSFGTKTKKSEEDSTTKTVFNNALSSLPNDEGPNKKIMPTFGRSEGKVASTPAPSLIFGGKAGDSVTTTNSNFTFGSEVSKQSGVPVPSFSFTVPAMKDDSKQASVPPFTFGSKRDSSESDELSKKMPFGSSASSTTLSNNVSAKPMFTFGSKENTLGVGSGFGPPPTTTPAFGAPAPTCNATSNFQFGHNNNPVPAATAPVAPAFSGAAAAAFGSNNSTASFAFGQAAKKNISAGFDFGQAANNASSQGFNFASGGATAPLFQFGQKQNDTAVSAPVFQFGAGGTGVEATPSFGGENPFNTPAPPSGRVVKKARRRKQ